MNDLYPSLVSEWRDPAERVRDEGVHVIESARRLYDPFSIPYGIRQFPKMLGVTASVLIGLADSVVLRHRIMDFRAGAMFCRYPCILLPGWRDEPQL